MTAASLAELPRAAEAVRSALSEVGLSPERPVLVLVGGASRISAAVSTRLSKVLGCLTAVLDETGAAVVDGGTAFGVMAAMGEARRRARAGFPLIGVAAMGTVDSERLPGHARCGRILDACVPVGARGVALDPNHSHFILVPGERWGDESPWIHAVAQALAGRRPSLTLVAAGGEFTRLDVAGSLAARRPCLVLDGSGGVSDLLAAWARGEGGPPGPELTGGDLSLLRILALDTAEDFLPDVLREAFAPEARA
ncbi:hypothetical protein [Thiorhodococcus minor]|nr:hypothetical protein [Thiorhodococcus minor]